MKRIFYARKEAKLIAKESKRPVGKTEMKYHHEYEISTILLKACMLCPLSVISDHQQQHISWFLSNQFYVLGQITIPAVEVNFAINLHEKS